MARHPEAQTRAQAELDEVLGNNQLPSLADRPQLPYTDAILSEVLRCAPITPLGFPHRLRADDVHCGYFIPQDTVVMPNVWFVIIPRLQYQAKRMITYPLL
jgi:cytochrome P450